MNELIHGLEAFYLREEPRGVAFVGANFSDVAFGRSPSSIVDSVKSVDGLAQLHYEHLWVSAFVSSFGRGKWLVVQFPFQEEFPPPLRPWRAFVRLAMEVQRWLENSDDTQEPSAGVAVRKPPGPGPHSRLRAVELPRSADRE